MAPKSRAGRNKDKGKGQASASQPRDDSSEQEYDETRFINFQAQERYEKFVRKTLIPEREVEYQSEPFDHQIFELVRENLASQTWDNLVTKLAQANVSLVYEFYANLRNKHNDKVFVRGKRVPFIAEAINRFSTFHI